MTRSDKFFTLLLMDRRVWVIELLMNVRGPVSGWEVSQIIDDAERLLKWITEGTK